MAPLPSSLGVSPQELLTLFSRVNRDEGSFAKMKMKIL
jgi:hypothetical protein